MRESRKSPALSLLSAVVMTGLVVSYFFLPDSSSMHADGMVGTPWLSTLLAIVFLTAIAVSMGLLNYSSFLFTSDTKLLYLPYLIFVLSVPGSMDFGLWHIAALLTVLSMFYAAGYVNSERVRMDFVFGTVLTAGAASLMIPQLVYVQAFLFLYCFYMRGYSPFRYLLASVAGAAVPWLYLLSWSYVFPDSLIPADYLRGFRSAAALSMPEPGTMELSVMIWAGYAILLVLRSIFFVLSRNRERNKAQKNSFGLSVALSSVVILLTVFCGGLETPAFAMAASVPVSFVVFDLFTNGSRAEVNIWMVLLLIIATVQRMSEFLPELMPS